jgi:hypothetical protein
MVSPKVDQEKVRELHLNDPSRKGSSPKGVDVVGAIHHQRVAFVRI